jgi:hypothetical protein
MKDTVHGPGKVRKGRELIRIITDMYSLRKLDLIYIVDFINKAYLHFWKVA